MNTITINISMPKGLYVQAKAEAKKYHYTSISELIRDSMRWWMNDNLTRNGFTPQFENMVLRREKQSTKNDIVWEGKESDLVKYAKSPKKSRVYTRSKRTLNIPTRISRRGEFAGTVV